MSVNMFSQRALQTSTRRLALMRSSNNSLRILSPAAVAMGQIRPATTGPHAATTTVSSDEAYKLLAEQRTHRPVSPHLGIYKPQVTWIPSAMNRITGSILSGGLYIFGFAYLVAPALGWHLESASVAAAFAAWPIAAKLATKFFLLAWPFTFHSFNGLRHLAWDTGSTFSNKQVIVTGWTVIGISFVTALGLTFY